MIQWKTLNSSEQLAELTQQSFKHPVLIFKHSTRCSISAAAIDRLERNWNEEDMAGWQPYYLDILAYRPVSNAVEAGLGIEHQSPQAIVLRNGRPVYSASHFMISYQDIKASAGLQAATPGA